MAATLLVAASVGKHAAKSRALYTGDSCKNYAPSRKHGTSEPVSAASTAAAYSANKPDARSDDTPRCRRLSQGDDLLTAGASTQAAQRLQCAEVEPLVS
ncbi:hypothetical protein AVEN_250376-1 [Araneus ventricosus]|uniref:Uncharacterized protein n=1 Tax=Araneus ventricosus TaxID=182803 RepID=A0A4Y2QCY1_ARAVE|nr:hypothetical protein AVEN_250376-1 [Araneus ventricosus]